MEYDLKEQNPLPLGALRGRGRLAASEPGEGAPHEAICNSDANESDLPAPAPPSLEHFRTDATSSRSAAHPQPTAQAPSTSPPLGPLGERLFILKDNY